VNIGSTAALLVMNFMASMARGGSVVDPTQARFKSLAGVLPTHPHPVSGGQLCGIYHSDPITSLSVGVEMLSDPNGGEIYLETKKEGVVLSPTDDDSLMGRIYALFGVFKNREPDNPFFTCNEDGITIHSQHCTEVSLSIPFASAKCYVEDFSFGLQPPLNMLNLEVRVGYTVAASFCNPERPPHEQIAIFFNNNNQRKLNCSDFDATNPSHEQFLSMWGKTDNEQYLLEHLLELPNPEESTKTGMVSKGLQPDSDGPSASHLTVIWQPGRYPALHIPRFACSSTKGGSNVSGFDLMNMRWSGNCSPAPPYRPPLPKAQPGEEAASFKSSNSIEWLVGVSLLLIALVGVGALVVYRLYSRREAESSLELTRMDSNEAEVVDSL